MVNVLTLKQNEKQFYFTQSNLLTMLNSITSLGKWLFIIPFAAFGIMHFLGADKMAGMVPIPGGAIWVYITGLGMLAFALSVILGKMDKLAALLLTVLLLLMVVLIHLPSVMKGDQMAMGGLLKDIGLAGGALMYARGFAQDSSVVG